MRVTLFVYAAFAAAVLSSAPFPSRGLLGAELQDGSHDGGGTGGGSRGGSPGWEPLGKRNFSSQIRLHPYVLVMVTVPWSGESRSLMKEVAHMVANNQHLFDHMRLMFVYRNLEKILADVLHATEGITLLYFHQSKSFRYQGHLRAQSILSSVSHIMSLQPVEFPLKILKTAEELEVFFQSTDMAVLLLEFCGWSATLLSNMNNGSKDSSLSEQNILQSGSIRGRNVTIEADGTAFGRNGNQGPENEQLTCGVENVLSGLWLGDFSQSNETASVGIEAGTSDTGTACTLDKLQQFESFFSEFNKIVREFLMPPERQRFGVISERSLLPFLSVEDPETWLLLIHFPGVPNLSKILEDVDALRTALKMPHPAIVEVNKDQRNQEPVFPVDGPSIILFVDLSSESAMIREESKSALKVYRQLALHYQLLNQMPLRHENDNYKVQLMQDFQETQNKGSLGLYGHMATKALSSSRIAKTKDNMAVMIIKEGESIFSEKLSGDNQGNSAYDILQNLLHQQKTAMKTKEIKISLSAKEIGLQLLSDDFAVEVIDLQPPHQESDRFRSMGGSSIRGPDSQNVEHFPESSVNVQNYHSDDTKNVAADGKQSELITVSPVPKSTKESILSSKSITTSPEASQQSSKDEIRFSKSMGASEKPVGLSLVTTQAEIDLHPEQNLDSEEDHVGQDVAKEKRSTGISNLDEGQKYHHTFTGSFFFSDGGHRLLRSLTEGLKIPSVVILDPLLQQHYVLPQERHFTFDALVTFVDKFLNNSLLPCKRSESVTPRPREASRPPFVNLDFHEADSIPRVTANTLSELVLSSTNCDNADISRSSNIKNLICPWQGDILVLFSNSWCGFCQQMELVVREVYRAFKNLKSLLKSDPTHKAFLPCQDKLEDASINDLPSIYQIDCTLNDCSSFLRLYDKGEVYPTLVLFPVGKKDAITYEGDITVLDLFEFLANHGSSSHILNEFKSILWNQAPKGHGSEELSEDAFPVVIQEQTPGSGDDDYADFPLGTPVIRGDNQQPVDVHKLNSRSEESEQVVVGSVLIATEKLLNTVPFDKSSILVVKADQNEGFQGLILNKHLKWEIFEKLDEKLEPLKQAPLSYGGPVRMLDLPVCSLARKFVDGYSRVASNIYFGDPSATSVAIERIRSQNAPVVDLWFFLGFTSWGWDQLFDELDVGAWGLDTSVEDLEWPEI